jgi:hypothetical protein
VRWLAWGVSVKPVGGVEHPASGRSGPGAPRPCGPWLAGVVCHPGTHDLGGDVAHVDTVLVVLVLRPSTPGLTRLSRRSTCRPCARGAGLYVFFVIGGRVRAAVGALNRGTRAPVTYLGWVHRYWSRSARNAGTCAAAGGAEVGAWLGLHAVPGLMSMVTAVLGAVLLANLAVLVRDMVAVPRPPSGATTTRSPRGCRSPPPDDRRHEPRAIGGHWCTEASWPVLPGTRPSSLDVWRSSSDVNAVAVGRRAEQDEPAAEGLDPVSQALDAANLNPALRPVCPSGRLDPRAPQLRDPQTQPRTLARAASQSTSGAAAGDLPR